MFFTLQALRLYHDTRDVEFIVIDNFGCDFTRGYVEDWHVGRYINYSNCVGTSLPRDLVFKEASGEVVMCLDCHVLLVPGALTKLRKFYSDNPGCMDLIQGPMLHDDLRGYNTHFDPVWREHMFGIWATDPRGGDVDGQPFEIPMQGLGLFVSRRDAWLGFNQAFRGFGGEEGYIHEKYRQAGRRCLCAPWLRWVHRFGRPYGTSYPLSIDDRVRNYLIGHDELKMDLRPIFEHFAAHVSRERLGEIAKDALGDRDFSQFMK